MVDTTACKRVEWVPLSGSWEEAVKPYQRPTAPESLADNVMTDRETDAPPGEGS